MADNFPLVGGFSPRVDVECGNCVNEEGALSSSAFLDPSLSK